MIRILGIDPGSLQTGFGLIDMDGNRAVHVGHGVIKVRGETLAERLELIFTELDAIIAEHRPAEVGIEQVFMHRNADSALKLGQARGAAITACARQQLAVHEYTATQVKQATVGKGHAAKQQVQHMIRVLLCLGETPPADAADALAVAVCHGHSRAGLMRMTGVSGMRGGRLR